MTKNIMKTVAITAITALMLTGCAENKENNFNVNESINNSVEEPITSTTTTSTVESEPVETISTSEVKEETEKPTASTTTSTTTSKPTEKPEVKPTSSSTSSTTTSKPTEKPEENPIETPTHTHKFSKATCEKPATCECGATKGNALGHNFTNATCNKLATCTTCGATKGTLANHNYIDGICTICGKNDPNYKAPHNCDIDGHIWVDNGTKTSTESVEIVETHDVCANGYDYDLAYKYFGRTSNGLDFTPYFGTNAYGNGSTKVKTIGTKTITTFYHKCTECGVNEVYNTEETVTPGDTWEFVYGPRSEYFPIIWYDINNIPAEVYEGAEKDNKASEEFWYTF